MRRFILLLIAFVLMLGWWPAVPAEADVSSVRDLWIDISMGEPLIDWFNQTARPNDMARADHFSQAGLLEEVTAGRRLVVFKSVTEAERQLPRLADTIDAIGYNLEHGPAYPAEDKADPVGSVQQMRQLADQYGLTLAFGPDHDFALSHGVQIAPYVDIFVLQVQRVQTSPPQVHDFVVPLSTQLRDANPDLQLSVQVRTEGDVVAIVDLLDSLKPHLDGVSILTSPETVEIAMALGTELRTRTPPTSVAAETEIADIVGTPRSDIGEPGSGGVSSWIPVLGAFAAGAVVGGTAATLVCVASRSGGA